MEGRKWLGDRKMIFKLEEEGMRKKRRERKENNIVAPSCMRELDAK